VCSDSLESFFKRANRLKYFSAKFVLSMIKLSLYSCGSLRLSSEHDKMGGMVDHTLILVNF